MKFEIYINKLQKRFPYLTRENICRILILYHGVNVDNLSSFEQPTTREELFFDPIDLSDWGIMAIKNPHSPLSLVVYSDKSAGLFWRGEYVSRVENFKVKHFSIYAVEPFAFLVTELDGRLILKLNPIQMCDFFTNPLEKPCEFCFRKDMTIRFTNIEVAKLIQKIKMNPEISSRLDQVDEVSIVTGSYINDAKYMEAMILLTKSIKKLINSRAEIVIGSHEGKGRAVYQVLHRAGVSNFAFSIESVSDKVRHNVMDNRKGRVLVSKLIEYIGEAVSVFGAENVFVRLVVGLGDIIETDLVLFINRIQSLNDGKNLLWNFNIYMPFSHDHWKIFAKKPPFSLDYALSYANKVNQYIPSQNRMRFKISW